MNAASMPPSPAAVPKPLKGTIVLDFSRLLPGAYCTWLLASLGAHVIKIEQPGLGDYQRTLGVQADDRGSAVFQMVNRGKTSLGLDLKNPQSAPVLDRLIAQADILVESFRPGVAKRLGIDFQQRLTERPSLVCLSISGYGSNSPLRSVAAHDINYIAQSGALLRQLDAGGGLPEIPFVDLIGGGLVPALSAIALLLRAKLTGVGGIADSSLADALPLLPNEVLATAMLGLPETAIEDAPFSGAAPFYSLYPLQDGYVAVGAVEERFWSEFCRLMEVDASARAGSAEDLRALRQNIAEKFLPMTRAEVGALFEGTDTCVTLVDSYSDMLSSPHARVRQFVKPPAAGERMPALASPFVHDGNRQFSTGPAPLLGEQSPAILAELGFTAAEIASLEADGVVATASGAEAGDLPA